MKISDFHAIFVLDHTFKKLVYKKNRMGLQICFTYQFKGEKPVYMIKQISSLNSMWKLIIYFIKIENL